MNRFDALRSYLIENEDMPEDVRKRGKGTRGACKFSFHLCGFPRIDYILFSDEDNLYGVIGTYRDKNSICFEKLESKKASIRGVSNRRIVMQLLRSDPYLSNS